MLSRCIAVGNDDVNHDDTYLDDVDRDIGINHDSDNIDGNDNVDDLDCVDTEHECKMISVIFNQMIFIVIVLMVTILTVEIVDMMILVVMTLTAM